VTSLTIFNLLNVADTCALWNLLGSPLLHRAAKKVRVSICATQFVRYECLFKSGANSISWIELRSRLQVCLGSNEIMFCDIDLEDLQEVASLEGRMAISKGELSSIAFAKRTCQSFLSDDRQAKILAKSVLDEGSIQDIPHLCGWLCINDVIHESDGDTIRAELKTLQRYLDPHIANAFRGALEIKLMRQMENQKGDPSRDAGGVE
jgi:hypothetical protein